MAVAEVWLHRHRPARALSAARQLLPNLAAAHDRGILGLRVREQEVGAGDCGRSAEQDRIPRRYRYLRLSRPVDERDDKARLRSGEGLRLDGGGPGVQHAARTGEGDGRRCADAIIRAEAGERVDYVGPSARFWLLSLMPKSIRQTSTGRTIPAPVGGWNARDSIAEMPPTDAAVLTNLFPG